MPCSIIPGLFLMVVVQIVLNLTLFHDDTHAPITTSTCLRSATVVYHRRLHDLVIDALSGTGEAFNRWIHPQLLPSIDGHEYNEL